MKFVCLSALLVSTTFAAAVSPTDTAYTALRVVGKHKGQSVLSQVVELRGRNGTPQPAVWKIVINDAAARGGIREIEVQRGKIIGERTPTSRVGVGEPMDLSHLNLDSEGVFTVLNQEAEQHRIPFDRMDYSLRSGSGGGAPVWTAELYDGRRGRVATYEVAADSGTILGQTTRGPVLDSPNDRDYVRSNPPTVTSEETVYNRRTTTHTSSYPGEKFRGVGDFFTRLGKRFERRGEQLENFFTGKRGANADRP